MSGHKEALIFDHVTFSYNQTPVLTNVSFQVYYGEFLGIIGPNGGGKTTALKLTMGFLSPSSGTIQVLGSRENNIRTKIGYVPQVTTYDKKFPISVLEVILTGSLSKLSIFGRVSTKEKKRALDLIDDLGINKITNRPFGSLSGGQAQKVLIARALMCDPSLLLLDEPTANIDPESENAIFTYLQKFRGSKTIMVVMHNFDAIIKNTERILCFQNKVTSLKPKEVCEHFTIGMYHETQKKTND